MGKDEIVKLFEKYGYTYAEQQEKSMNRLYLSKLILRVLGNLKGKKVLDAGCGAGFETRKLAKRGAEVTGIDICPKMVEIARQKCKGVQFYIRDVCRCGFARNTFDVILSAFVIPYNEDLKALLKEHYRVLKKGGVLLLVDVHPIRKMVAYTMNYFETGKHWEVSEGWKRFAYYRKVEDILNTAIEVGFTLKAVREPKPVGVNNGFYPYYILLKLEK
jgi:ubiquinone/menaquinone biosynthesis C-methylase UbiE